MDHTIFLQILNSFKFHFLLNCWWMLTLHQIGLDVVRTDKTLVLYEKQENLSKLWDILAVYAWIDKDIDYCQGG
uniref:Rab-GAP TBC domain-containing protein n=1 Tax=Cucumis melo TaxID=3656 RepID=A0A9I9DWW2_CUCME